MGLRFRPSGEMFSHGVKHRLYYRPDSFLTELPAEGPDPDLRFARDHFQRYSKKATLQNPRGGNEVTAVKEIQQFRRRCRTRWKPQPEFGPFRKIVTADGKCA
jgi:hypothetical protein